MRSRWDTKKDSLDLLLNTLCDVFGSFILIALILVLPTGIKQVTTPKVDNETLQRRIATAREEGEAIDKRIAELAIDPDIARLQAERARLDSTIKSLKERTVKLDSDRSKALNASSRDVAKEDAALQEQIRNVRIEQETVKNAIDTATGLESNLKNRIDSINGKIADAKKVRIQQMRLPRERHTDKGAVNVIIRYGRIYPLQLSPNSIAKNTDAIEWTDVGDDAFRATPIEGKGLLATNTAFFARWTSEVPSDCFVACYVYEDSIDAFRGFRKIVQDKNVDLGWEPVESSKGLRFGSHGSSPNPQ
jgi:hypothetical protein